MKPICFRNIRELIQIDGPAALRRHSNCALTVQDGRIKGILPDNRVRSGDYAEIVDLRRRAVIPGLVDCHTHLIYAGARKDEMEQRLKGAAYLDILRDGGGILSTVKATRRASAQSLYAAARQRMRRMITLGTTAFEIKSGYGLDLETELRILKTGRRLRDSLQVPVTLTYLGAHAVPPEYEKKEDYLEFILCHLPQFREAADGIDIFCERGAFSAPDLRRLFLQAKLAGFHQLRAHVEELSHQGGCYEAAKLGAISCDHLEHAAPADIRAMKLSGAVAVLMPGVSLFLGARQLPLAHAMLEAGVTIALATDCNPGSCPSYNMQTVLYLAASLYRLTPEQALTAATYGSAKALDGHRDYGGLKTGQRADFLVLHTGDFRDLFYCFGDNLVAQTYIAGKRAQTAGKPAPDGAAAE